MAAVYRDRHIGLTTAAQDEMLASLRYSDIEEFLEAALPAGVIDAAPLDLPEPLTEVELLQNLRSIADQNEVRTPLIGMGYYRCHTPAVIRRNVLESPAWYTAYTPYQPEISQGRLEALLVFQTMVADLTGLETANASLLDEPTAAAEAMALAHRASKNKSDRFLVDADTHPQTVAVLETRAKPLGISLVLVDTDTAPTGDFFGALLSYPASSGRLAADPQAFITAVKDAGGIACVASDLLALTVLKSPGDLGADVAIGSAQRFGVPLGFGGPHAGFMAVRSGLERTLPGRLVGVSTDTAGKPAYRLALQTREQHIRREKATSNICTSQVLLAVVSAFYAAYHGPQGLTDIATGVNSLAVALSEALERLGVSSAAGSYFGTVTARADGNAAQVVKAIGAVGIDVRLVDSDRLSIAVDEATTVDELNTLLGAVAEATASAPTSIMPTADWRTSIPESLRRTSSFMTHPWFGEYQSETSMMRWLRRLADDDLALDRSMIPLGSCTMKLNAAAAMEPISWPGFADIHPFAPAASTVGYTSLVETLSTWLATITGYAQVSLQPNAGSQGEFAGLLAIQQFHQANGDDARVVCLIPASAHGTNAASAAMAGMRVVVVACDDTGGVDLADLRTKIAEHHDELAAIMVTYPSTYGVYEDTINEVCDLVHAAGGQVYVDGANLNALVGWSRFGGLGADVSHLNLHKTFCIPHGGGGPGVGPVAVQAHLAPYLPSTTFGDDDRSRISGAPYGSAGILPIPYAYIAMMGPQGLKAATSAAVLAANYVARRLSEFYPVLYTGKDGLVAHECILDLRGITKTSGVTVDDVAKRLIDYGFHAPTMSFPVSGTLMVEPTESESKDELDRFCDAMIAIRAEISQVEAGDWDVADSPLRNAPHTAESLVGEWDRSYSRELAVYPLPEVRANKYWPPVGRIDGAYGDRNLMCSCPPIDSFA